MSEEDLNNALADEGLVAIPRGIYEILIEESNTLAKLEAAGVDNWEGYSFAFEDEDEEEDD